MTDIFRSNNGDRPSVPNVAITVGASMADRRQNEFQAVSVAAREAGIKLVMVGVTQHRSPSQEEIDMTRAIGTEIYLVERFENLASVVDVVVDQSCQEEG